MNLITVGVGEWVVSSQPQDVLKTYALGSCLGVMIYDCHRAIAGLIHIALPDSTIDVEKAMKLPGYFADTGLPLMIEEMKGQGCVRSSVWVKIAGGSTLMDETGIFDIGKRNILAAKRILWKSTLGPIAEDIGGNISRTITFSVITGEVKLNSAGNEWLI